MSNQFACLNTKIMGMRGSTLDEHHYDKMISARDVTGVFEVLKNQTAYGEDFWDFDAGYGIHRQEIEWRLRRFQIRQAEKFFFYVKGNEKKMIETLLMPMEIAALSRLIRGLATGEDLQKILETLVWSERAASVNFEQLSYAENWSEFKQGLKQSPYFRLCEVYPSLGEEGNLFQIEKSIERYYYDQLNKMLSLFKGKESRLLVQTFRKEIDLINLVWIYRGKFYYHLPKATLIAFCLMGGEEISLSKMQAFIEAKDLTSFIEIVDTLPEYHFLFNHGKTLDLYMERRKSRFLYYALKKLYTQSGGIGKAAAFIRLTGYEIQDIISIIESKRYGMTDQACRAFLIRDFDK